MKYSDRRSPTHRGRFINRRRHSRRHRKRRRKFYDSGFNCSATTTIRHWLLTDSCNEQQPI